MLIEKNITLAILALFFCVSNASEPTTLSATITAHAKTIVAQATSCNNRYLSAKLSITVRSNEQLDATELTFIPYKKISRIDLSKQDDNIYLYVFGYTQENSLEKTVFLVDTKRTKNFFRVFQSTTKAQPKKLIFPE